MTYRVIKRISDILISLIAVCVLLIPWLVIAVVIKIQSPGPALYKATRVGKDGKTFTLYKFRSMRIDSGAIHTTTLRGDSRIFPFGAFLRKSKLDETPQFINILKGEMTVIGPRPEDVANADVVYAGKYREILKAVPGLSSPASLYDYTHGEKYEDEEMYNKEFLPQKLAVELYYVQHRTLSYEAKIMIRTAITIVEVICGRENFKEPEELQMIHNEE